MNMGTPAKYVDLIGQINIGGISTRNLDAVRDLCDLHLHQETGGVFVTRGDDTFYIGPSAISSVHLEKSVEESRTVAVPKAMLAPKADDVQRGAENLADSVLKELQGDDAPASSPRKSPRTRGVKN